MRAILLSIAVGVPTGALGLWLGIQWENLVVRKDWRGWHFPEMTEDERKEWGI